MIPPDPDPLTPAERLQRQSADELLDDVRWLRRLAFALVERDADADDLVQEALGVVAVRREPVRDWRAFLAGTLRHLALRGRRQAERRRRREGLRARPEQVEGDTEWIDRMDSLRVLLEEVQALPASQGRVVASHYLDGLSLAEIAEREGSQPSTVRAHLSRGLASLRQRMDRRHGSREAWCTVAWMSWASSKEAAPSSAVAMAAGGALSGAVIMSTWTKGAALAAVVILGVGTWWQVGRTETVSLAPPEPGAVQTQVDGLQAAADPVAMEQRSLAASHEPEATQPGGAVDASLQLVDASTGEFVPFLSVSLDAGFESQEVRSDGAGRVASVVWDRAPERVSLQEIDGQGMARPLPRNLTWPLGNELPVYVGPTFSFLTDAYPQPGPGWEAHFLQPGRREALAQTALRSDGELAESWVRFPHTVTSAGGEGPWTLEVLDEHGYHRGRAEVFRKRGVESTPVALRWQATGAVTWALRYGQLPQGRLPIFLNLQDPEGTVERHTVLAPRQPGLAEVVAKHLAPGTYRWSLGEAFQQTGEVEVLTGETSNVTVELASAAETFDAVVELDARVRPELDLSEERIVVYPPDDLDSAFMASARRDPQGERGLWRIELSDVPTGDWNVLILLPLSGLAWEPAQVTVGPDSDPARMTLIEEGPKQNLRLEVLSQAGTPLRGVEGVYGDQGSSSLTFLNGDGRGGLLPLQVPQEKPTVLVVRSPGYASREVRFDPTVDRSPLRIHLKEGWSNFVRVVSAQSFEPRADVEILVDGRSAGRTGEDGRLWFTGTGPPKSLELVGLEPSHEPTDQELADDPVQGWILTVPR